ncbi:MAG: hypothetical protein ABEH88_06230, partial [Halobacteriales archaeon]
MTADRALSVVIEKGTGVILQYGYDGPVFPVVAVVIGVCLVKDIDPDAVVFDWSVHQNVYLEGGKA